MPPASKKDCSIILYDVKAGNREKCMQTLLKISCAKYFTGPKDLTKLILMNTEKTDNQLAARYGGYSHIYETTEHVVSYDPKDLLEAVEEAKPGNASWLEALEVALWCLEENYQDIKGIVTYQLIFLTDLVDSPLNGNTDKLQSIIDKINNIVAYLYIIGPEINIPFTIKSSNDVRKWMRQLVIDKPTENLKIAKKIIDKTENSVICDRIIGNQLVFSYKNWGGTQPWNVPLAVGSELEITAQTVRILKRFSDCRIVNAGEKIEWAWIDAEDETVTVDFSDVISGISRHGKFIKLELETSQMFKGNDPRSLQVMCFTDYANVPEYLMMGEGSYYVLPAKDSNDNCFSCLIDCLLEQKKYAIARRVYNKGFNPKFVVLVPKSEPKCFVMAELPYADDVAMDFTETSENLLKEKGENVEEIYEFLDGLSEKNDCLNVSMMQNINVQKIINKTADKYMEKHLHLNEIDYNYLNVKKDEKLQEKLKKLWPEREIDKDKSGNENVNEADLASDVEYDWS